ncbi:hypothetical protein [Hymenobacter sp. B81]|uniref:hypothetical protein n=1 Tax=Hymenobacter sp. B81 TaxID=3344878 RepID=UPI0037DC2ACB
MLHRYLRLLLPALPVLLSACSVYAPMQPAAPLLTDRGQAEVAAHVHLNGQVVGSAAYSPVKHVLVLAGGAFKADGRDTTYARNQQLEGGLGFYLTPTPHLVLSGLGGYGQARSARGFADAPLFGTSELMHYTSRYHKVFGQASAVWEWDYVALGAVYRLTQARFDELLVNGQPVPLRHLTRHEPTLLMRFGFMPTREQSWLQFQTAFGASWGAGYTDEQLLRQPSTVRYVRQSALLATVGVVFYPHRLPKRAAPTPQP